MPRPGMPPGTPKTDSYLRASFVSGLRAKLNSSASGANYLRDLPWRLLPDLASVLNGDRHLGYLTIPAFRTSGHGLGASVSKKASRPRTSIESCPWCKHAVSDDACHAITSCTHPESRRIRERQIPGICEQMRMYAPTWVCQFDAATSACEQSALILGAGCWPATDPVRRVIVRKVADLLCQIRKAHPTYRRYFHNAPLESLSYYGPA